MDLALALGGTAESLANTMTERELQRWMQYQRRNGLPLQRIELYLAQLTHAVWAAAGSKKAKIADFIFQPAEPEVDVQTLSAQELVDVARAEFKFNPRKKKVKKDASI